MKKLNAKYIASSALAVIVASMMAVSAGASSTYIVPPPYIPVNPPTSSGSTTPTTSTTPTDDKTTDSATIVVTGSTIGEPIVKDAIGSGKPIEVTLGSDGKVIIPEAAIAAIKEGGKAITIIVNSSEVPYTVTIDPKDIDAIKDVNIAMHIHVGLPDGVLTGTDVLTGVIFIGPEMKGAWPISLGLTIPASALKDLDFAKIGLYYIADDGKVSDISEKLVKNADGSVTITSLSHASAYVISDVDLTESALDAGLDIDDADDDDSIDDNIDDVIDDVTIDEPSATTGKDDTSVVVNAGGNDTNPVTGTTLALGSLAVFAAAAVATSKKRK